jgi:predicted DNA-binding transcriptional regulator AlpA
VASASLPRERESCLQHFFALPPQDQLVAYRAIREHLGRRIHETKRDRLIEERTAALEAMRRVAAHLDLEDARAPTPREFEVAARELALGFSRSRVQRAWGRWRFAKEAFLGHVPESAVQRDVRLAATGPRQKSLSPLESVRRWLATKPRRHSGASYCAWAREYNERRAVGEPPVAPKAPEIAASLGMHWPDVVRLAGGEIRVEDARPVRHATHQRHCRGPHDLVSFREVKEMLGETKTSVAFRITHRADFPNPVISTKSHRLWLRSDVEAYRGNRPFPHRDGNELRPLYLTRAEVMAATGLSWEQVRTGARGLPKAAVCLGSAHLWLRSEVEEWLGARDAGRGS